MERLSLHGDLGGGVVQGLPARGQGLTLVHFLTQCKRFLRDRLWIQGLCRACVRGVMGFKGVSSVYFAAEMAQVELKSGRV